MPDSYSLVEGSVLRTTTQKLIHTCKTLLGVVANFNQKNIIFKKKTQLFQIFLMYPRMRHPGM